MKEKLLRVKLGPAITLATICVLAGATYGISTKSAKLAAASVPPTLAYDAPTFFTYPNGTTFDGYNQLGNFVGYYGYSANGAVYFDAPQNPYANLPMPSGFGGEAEGINVYGHIVGYGIPHNSTIAEPLYWSSPTATPGFFTRPMNSYRVVATTINDHGDIAGYAQFGGSVPTTDTLYWTNPWDAPIDLTNAGVPVAMNNSSTILTADRSTFQNPRVWASPSATSPIFLKDTTGSAASLRAYAMNTAGTVCGYTFTTQGNYSLPTIWTGPIYSPTVLPMPSGVNTGVAFGINDSGMICRVLSGPRIAGYACIWPSASSMPINLNNIVPPGTPWLHQASVILNDGTFIGFSFPGSSSTQNFVAKLEPYSLSFTSGHVIGGNKALAHLVLNQKQPTDTTFTLSSSSADVTVPASVIIPAGQTYLYQYWPTSPVAASETVSVTATWGSRHVYGTVTLTPPLITSLTAASTTVKGGSYVLFNLHLGAKAPSPGVAINVTSSSASAAAVGSVTVPTGQNYVYFYVKTSAVSANTNATITVSDGANSQQLTLTIMP